jgi:transaldolase
MKPANLETQVFLDSGNPADTKKAIELLGFLDGQTTNPSLVAKNPDIKPILEEKGGFTREELLSFYKQVIQEISALIPKGSVSIEVYANENSTKEDLVDQAKEMNTWIPNAHIKFPTTQAGLAAAEEVTNLSMKVNMTLVFQQGQAAAVHAATKSAKKGDVFLSPFIGRLDDIGVNGMDLIKNINRLYGQNNSHVLLLAASIRNLEHLYTSLKYKADIITCPLSTIESWKNDGLKIPGDGYEYKPQLQEIPYLDLDLNKNWDKYEINHSLTDKGQTKFAQDWDGLIRGSIVV